MNLTRVAAVEYASRGIRVNCVCPGAIDTPLLRPSLSIPGFAEQTLQQIPMRRLGRPEEMAGVVMFLASDLASYVTGATLHVNGGTLASSGWFNWPETGWSNTPPDRVLDSLVSSGPSDGGG